AGTEPRTVAEPGSDARSGAHAGPGPLAGADAHAGPGPLAGADAQRAGLLIAPIRRAAAPRAGAGCRGRARLAPGPAAQCDISTGMVMDWSTVRVTPPRTNSTARE